MKKILFIISVLFIVSCSSQYKYVYEKDSKHTVKMKEHLKVIEFDSDIYLIKQNEPGKRIGWYIDRSDTIVWVYAKHNNDVANVIKIGYYNNFKNYVVSQDTELKPVSSK